VPPNERPIPVPEVLTPSLADQVAAVHRAARAAGAGVRAAVPRAIPAVPTLAVPQLGLNLPPVPSAPVAPRLPAVEGRPGAFTIRGPDGAEWPVDPDDPAALRALAARLLEPR
jgi:hypothetical protein